MVLIAYIDTRIFLKIAGVINKNNESNSEHSELNQMVLLSLVIL